MDSIIKDCKHCGFPIGKYDGVWWHVRQASQPDKAAITAMGCRAASRLRGEVDESLRKGLQATPG